MKSHEKQVRKMIFSRMKGFRFWIAASFLMCLVLQLMGLVPPLVMQQMVDVQLPEGRISEIVQGIILLVGIPMASAAGNAFYQYFLNAVGRRYSHEMMHWGIEKILSQPLTYFDDKNSAELTKYCDSESVKYIVFWMFDIPQITAKLVSGVVILGLMMRINLWMGLVSLLYVPLTILPCNALSKRIQGYVQRAIHNNARLAQVLTDTFRGIRHIKAAGRERQQLQRVKNISEDTIRVWSMTCMLDNLTGMWAGGFMSHLFNGLLFGIGVVLILRGQLTMGNLLILINYMPKAFAVINDITKINFDFKKQLAEFEPLFEIISMDTPEVIYETTDKLKIHEGIAFKHVSFSYPSNPEKEVLIDVNLSVPKGTWVGLVGTSGAGKSTIFNLLLRLYQWQKGEIEIDGCNLSVISPRVLRNSITLVSQDAFMFPGTVRDNLQFVSDSATDEDMWRVLDSVGLKSKVKSLPKGLDSEIGEEGSLFSGGEVQRLSLAQGLLRGSEILLLDEVTANVDSGNEKEILKQLAKSVKEQGVTVISISHKASFNEFADCVYTLRDGVIESSK